MKCVTHLPTIGDRFTTFESDPPHTRKVTKRTLFPAAGRRTDGRTRWNQYTPHTPPSTSLGRGIKSKTITERASACRYHFEIIFYHLLTSNGISLLLTFNILWIVCKFREVCNSVDEFVGVHGMFHVIILVRIPHGMDGTKKGTRTTKSMFRDCHRANELSPKCTCMYKIDQYLNTIKFNKWQTEPN